jgi:hypothetical protein
MERVGRWSILVTFEMETCPYRVCVLHTAKDELVGVNAAPAVMHSSLLNAWESPVGPWTGLWVPGQRDIKRHIQDQDWCRLMGTEWGLH